MRTKANHRKRRCRTDCFVGYCGETAAELFSHRPQGRYDALVQAFREGVQRKTVRKGERALTAEERVVLAVTALEHEVNNGGYDQFFRNSSRKFAPVVVDSLMRIGHPTEAKITQRAIDALHLRTLNVRAINSAMATDSDPRDGKLERCDHSFYKVQRGTARRLYTSLKINRAHINF